MRCPPGIWWLIRFRGVPGSGIGGDCPVSATIMSECASQHDRGRMVALVFSTQGIGLVLGPAGAIGGLQAAPQLRKFLFAQAAPDAVHLPGLDRERQALRADPAPSADPLGLFLLPLAGTAGGNREEQVRVGRQAGAMGTPVGSVINHSHQYLANACNGLDDQRFSPRPRLPCHGPSFFDQD